MDKDTIKHRGLIFNRIPGTDAYTTRLLDPILDDADRAELEEYEDIHRADK